MKDLRSRINMKNYVAMAVAFLLMPSFSQAAEPVRVLFDTDMDSDCDDVGALAVLHALADRGEAQILATTVSSRHPWSPACAAALNTFYGRPDLRIGNPKSAGAMKPSKYAREIAERFPQKLWTGDKIPDAREVYRGVLSKQPDGSVVLVTVGYLTNVAQFLRLPAEKGMPSGMDLAKSKVKMWVCMGGNFVGRPAMDDLKLSNNNFTYDKESSLYAVQNWPGKLVFVGREIGSVPSGLKAGARLKELPEKNPLRHAYELYFGGQPKDRHVADQTAVLYAVRGLADYWEEEPAGLLDLKPDMTFRWKSDPMGRQSYLLKRPKDTQATDRRIERIIEDLMLQGPKK